MRPKNTYEQREQLIGHLLRRREAGERLGADTIELAANMLDVSKSSVWRWIKAGGVPRRRGPDPLIEASEELDDLAIECRGNFSAMSERLAEQNVSVSRQTIMRAFRRADSAAFVASARKGNKGLRSHMLRVEMRTEFRNQVWQADCSMLPVRVRIKGLSKPQIVWITLFLDAHTRAIMGYALTVGKATTAASVLAALRDAITVDEDRGPFGGLPAVLIYDGGKQYLSDALTQAELMLGIRGQACHPYMPENKGKVERLFRTLKEQALGTLPFNVDNPRQANEELYDVFGEEPPTYARLASALDEWIAKYNVSRAHSALGGLTPLEAWLEDATPLEHPETQQLAWACMELAEGRKLQDAGLKWKGKYYVDDALAGHVGELFDFRFTPHDHRSIEVFQDGRYVCRAVPSAQASAEKRAQIQETQKADERRARQARARVKKQFEARMTPSTGIEEPQDGTVVSVEVADRVRAKASERSLAAASKDSLLVGADKGDESAASTDTKSAAAAKPKQRPTGARRAKPDAFDPEAEAA